MAKKIFEGNTKPDHVCPYSDVITELKVTVEDLKHIVRGNSKPGLADTVPLLVDGLTGLRETMLEFSKSISGFQKFQMDYEIRAELKKKEQERKEAEERSERESIKEEKAVIEAKLEVKRINAKWLVGIIITLILGIGGLYLNMRKDIREQEKFDRELLMGEINSRSEIDLRSDSTRTLKNFDPFYYTENDSLDK